MRDPERGTSGRRDADGMGGKGLYGMLHRDRVGRAIIAAGFGPSCFDGEAGAPGDTPPAGGAPGTPPAGGEPDRSGFIPRERFDQVNGEYQRLKRDEDARIAEAAKKAGDFEKVEAGLKARAETAEQRVVTVARRAAFIAASSGKVANPEAAYKLAAADGLLNDLDVDDDGNPKDAKAVAKLVEDLAKTYEFLKIDDKKTRSFGDDRSGADGGTPIDPSKMGSREMLSAGYAAIGEPRRRS